MTPTEPKKPEKQEHSQGCHFQGRHHEHDCNCGVEDYNAAIDLYSKWYDWKMGQLPNVEKIRTAIEESTFKEYNYRTQAEMLSFGKIKEVTNSTDLAKLISKRMRQISVDKCSDKE